MTDENFKTDGHGRDEMGARGATLRLKHGAPKSGATPSHKSLAFEKQLNLAINIQ
ncbi:hypothetical protein [Variovorax durovernensis]